MTNNNPAWPEERLEATIREITDMFGYMPPQELLNQHGFIGVHMAMWRAKGLEYYKAKYNVESRKRLYSTDAQKWRSAPETCLANFLLARGLAVQQGKWYPDDFRQEYGVRAVYDMHFVATAAQFLNQIIDVEVWGDGQSANRKETYAAKRDMKEEYNKNNENFLGLHFTDCYSESKLELILTPYLHNLQPISVSPFCASSVTSLFEDLLEKSRTICDRLPGGILPAHNWFYRIGKFSERAIEDWEPVSWSGYLYDIRLCGGISNVQKALGQESYVNRAVRYTKEDLISRLKALYDQTHKSPCSLHTVLTEKLDKTEDDKRLLSEVSQLIFACKNHFKDGVREAGQQAEIPMHSYQFYSRESALEAIRTFIAHHQKSPGSVKFAMSKIRDKTQEQITLYREAACLIAAGDRFYGKYSIALAEARKQ